MEYPDYVVNPTRGGIMTTSDLEDEEEELERIDRITHVPNMMGGKATIRGIRVTVGMILDQLGAGQTINELLDDFRYLEREDILQAIRFGALLVRRERPAH
jgi:uncharacterized protein (DUF433 family)